MPHGPDPCVCWGRLAAEVLDGPSKAPLRLVDVVKAALDRGVGLELDASVTVRALNCGALERLPEGYLHRRSALRALYLYRSIHQLVAQTHGTETTRPRCVRGLMR
jgi:hypothetical protein